MDKWPERLSIRDTKIYDDLGGLGQRIFTTAGAAYEKHTYYSEEYVSAKQARIEALEKDFAYHAELCTSQQARIGALTAEVEEQARLLGASGSREAELLARVEALENAAKSVAKAKGKGFAQVHKDDVPWFMHLMNRIDALAALLQEPTK